MTSNVSSDLHKTTEHPQHLRFRGVASNHLGGQLGLGETCLRQALTTLSLPILLGKQTVAPMGGRLRQCLHKEGQQTGEQATGLIGLQCVCSGLLQGTNGLD